MFLQQTGSFVFDDINERCTFFCFFLPDCNDASCFASSITIKYIHIESLINQSEDFPSSISIEEGHEDIEVLIFDNLNVPYITEGAGQSAREKSLFFTINVRSYV